MAGRGIVPSVGSNKQTQKHKTPLFFHVPEELSFQNCKKPCLMMMILLIGGQRGKLKSPI